MNDLPVIIKKLDEKRDEKSLMPSFDSLQKQTLDSIQKVSGRSIDDHPRSETMQIEFVAHLQELYKAADHEMKELRETQEIAAQKLLERHLSIAQAAGSAMLEVFDIAENRIAAALKEGDKTCHIAFKPQFRSAVEHDTRLGNNIDEWRARFPHWHRGVEIISRELKSKGYKVSTLHEPPQGKEAVFHKGDDGSFDGYSTRDYWRMQNCGTVTLSFDLPVVSLC